MDASTHHPCPFYPGTCYADNGHCYACGDGARVSDERKLLEEHQIQWRRDFDALLAGYVLGVLSVLALIGMFQ